MIIHCAAPFESAFRGQLGSQNCPRCGTPLLLAEASAFLSDGRIRHFWSCDSCGQEFHTAVDVAARSWEERPRRPA